MIAHVPSRSDPNLASLLISSLTTQLGAPQGQAGATLCRADHTRRGDGVPLFGACRRCVPVCQRGTCGDENAEGEGGALDRWKHASRAVERSRSRQHGRFLFVDGSFDVRFWWIRHLLRSTTHRPMLSGNYRAYRAVVVLFLASGLPSTRRESVRLKVFARLRARAPRPAQGRGLVSWALVRRLRWIGRGRALCCVDPETYEW